MAPILETRKLSRDFPLGGGRVLRAVADLDLAVERGETLAVVGESGSGKTTLGRMLLGLAQPSSGDILFDGRPAASYSRAAFTRLVQPVFQDPQSSLNPRKTVEQIIALPLQVHRIGDAAERRRRVSEMMEHVGLSPRLLHAYPTQLSGGQRQRVAIARALAIRPQLVICDEPTSALDVSVQAQILNLLFDLRDEFGLTYIFISHDLGVVECIADRVAVMYMGRLVECGAGADLLARPRHPYTKALLASVLTPDPGFGLPELSLGAGAPDPVNPPPGCVFHPRCPEAKSHCASVAPAGFADAYGFVCCHP